jgi:hypothetical protein
MPVSRRLASVGLVSDPGKHPKEGSWAQRIGWLAKVAASRINPREAFVIYPVWHDFYCFKARVGTAHLSISCISQTLLSRNDFSMLGSLFLRVPAIQIQVARNHKHLVSRPSINLEVATNHKTKLLLPVGWKLWTKSANRGEVQLSWLKQLIRLCSHDFDIILVCG